MPDSTAPVTPPVDRRGAVALISGAALGALALGSDALAQATAGMNPKQPALSPKQLGWDPDAGEYVLPDLPYAKNALEPAIDAQTMDLHHSKHHAGHVAGLNKALRELRQIRDGQADPNLIKHWSGELAFHAAGHVNHTLFWLSMAPAGKGGGGQPAKGPFLTALERDFGSFEKFVGQFKAAATQVEGAGWAWLAVDPISQRLHVLQAEKHQVQVVGGFQPILGIDVWEHAYYLKYQNRRSDYVNAWMGVANWSFAQSMLERAMRK